MPEHVQDAAQDRVAHPDQMPGEREPRPEAGFDFRIGPARHVEAQAAPQRVLEVHEPAHEIEVELPCLRVTQPDVLVDEHPAVLKADVVAHEFPVMAVTEYHAADLPALQQPREEIPRQQVEMDFALGVDAEVEAVQLLQHIKAAEPGVPQRHGFDVQPFVRLQLAAQVLAAAFGEARQIFVCTGKINGNVGQRLPFHDDEPLVRRNPGQPHGGLVVTCTQQRGNFRHVLDDQQGLPGGTALAEAVQKRARLQALRERRVFGGRGPGETGRETQQARPQPEQGKPADLHQNRGFQRGQQIEIGSEDGQIRFGSGGKALRRVAQEQLHQRLGFEQIGMAGIRHGISPRQDGRTRHRPASAYW